MKSLAKLTLGKKVTLLVTLGLIVAAGVFGFLGIGAVNQATEAMLQERLTTARLVADYLDEALGRALAELKNFAQRLGSSAEGSLESETKALEDAYRRLAIYTSAIYLLDEEGRIIWSRPELPAAIGKDISYFPSINQAIKKRQATISGLLLAPGANIPAVLLASPLEERKRVIVVAIDPAQSSIGGFIQPVRLGETGYVEVVDQNGVVVARTEPGSKLAPFERSDHSGRFAALIAAAKPTRGLCHTCHVPGQKGERRDVLAFVPLSRFSWGVAIRQFEEEALAPVRELRRNLLFSGLGLIAIVLLLMAIINRDVVRRIRMLTIASHRIASGDLVSPIITSGRDEIGILAQSFEDLRAKLQTSYGQLEQRTKELSSLLAVSEILTSLAELSDLNSALSSALDKTLEIMRQEIGGILLMDEEGQVLRYRVHRGLSEEYVQGVRCRPGEGIAGRVAESGEPILLEDISADPRAAHPDLIGKEGLKAFASVPLRSKKQVLGVLNIASREPRKFSAEDVRLLEGIARQIAVAIENAKLHQEVRHKDEVRGELLREIFSIQEEERKRIARELHDESSQVLASLSANLEAALGMLPADEKKTKAILKKAQALSINLLGELHKLVYELRPTVLDDLGLVAALRWLADNNLKAAKIGADFKVIGREQRLPPQVESILFRVVQEAVSNIVKHARAQNASLSLEFKRDAIRVRISDDGKGFDVAEAISSKNRPRGLGLLGMKERVELVNGTLIIQSRIGGGTEIDIEIPLKKEVSHGENKSTGGR